MWERKSRQEYRMIGVDRGVECCSSTMVAWGEKPSHIKGQAKRLRCFLEPIRETHSRIDPPPRLIYLQDTSAAG